MNLDAAAVRAALERNPLAVAVALLGEPNQRNSSKTDIRFGNRGSLSLKGAVFYDHSAAAGGGMLDLICHVRQCDFPTALRIGAEIVGGVSSTAAARPAKRAAVEAPHDDTALVRAIWRETLPIIGTPVERYLARRKLALSPCARDIRFHPKCPRGADSAPAMVAAFRDIHSNAICGIHRTFLTSTGAKLEERAKMMLGRSKGAAIKLGDDANVTTGLITAEGIETALAMIGFGFAPIWALGSAGAIKAFPVLDGIEALTIVVDHDQSGTGDAAARECVTTWIEALREVNLIRSPAMGDDIADVMARAA